ncbi:hypothetical protein C8035_v012033 [Colletotrichum spinosum]|uniref:BZIP domain-containing protein n=1 Tax=Colletotrichum spinosum TaxID=1347390 RepID=A0A4V6QE95_9PEZI|nr:hypothetical protein C8035_v012033 [Colletotrichum spinosum]
MADHQLHDAGEGLQRGTAAAGDDDDNLNRPSFTDYWQGEKESERAGRVQFVSEGHPSSSSGGMQRSGEQGSSSLSASNSKEKAKEKAKLRRQQVRKAQIQHRTRKANYIKQLELDVCKFRDMIAAAEKDVLAYRRQNESMRDALVAKGLWFPDDKGKGREVVDEIRVPESTAPLPREIIQQPVELHSSPRVHYPQQQQHDQQAVQPQLDTQVYQEQLRQPPPESTAYQHQELDYDPYPPPDLFGDVDIGDITVTMAKDDTLGTPCFQISASSVPSSGTPEWPATPDQLSAEQEIIAINLILAMEHICWDHFHPRQYPHHADPCKAASGHTMMASTMCISSAPERVFRTIRRKEADTTTHTWRADTGVGSALSLRSLLSLAKTLNPGDIELTPVQAWFELAARYGAAVLMEDCVVEALKREFCGVVDCIHFGAIIERDAFESVVARVMQEVGVSELEYEMDIDVEGADMGMGSVGVRQVAA